MCTVVSIRLLTIFVQYEVVTAMILNAALLVFHLPVLLMDLQVSIP